MNAVKVNSTLYMQREMTRYWQTDMGAGYAMGAAEVITYTHGASFTPAIWNVADNEGDRTALAAALTHRTQISSAYWTKKEMVELTAAAASNRPGSAVYNTDLPHMHGFCVFEEPLLIDMSGQTMTLEDTVRLTHPDNQAEFDALMADFERGSSVNVAGFQWNQGSLNGQAGVDVILLSDPKDGRDGLVKYLRKDKHVFEHTPPYLILDSFFIPFGEELVEDDIWHSLVATWWHLISQPISATNVQQANPGMTRKAAKLELKPDITVVTLRPRKPTKSDPKNHRIVNWSHRWLVGAENGGIWREQWYPSLGIHKTIFVPMYEKGPLDKPLVIPRRKVYAWRR